MTTPAFIKEIIQTFINNVKAKNFLNDKESYDRLSRLFNNQSIPTSQQLQQALFKDEELP